MADQQYTVEDLGRAVKAQNPGAYDDVSDADLGRAKKQKHPEAYADFADVAQTRSLGDHAKSFGQGLIESMIGSMRNTAQTVVPPQILNALGMGGAPPTDLLPLDAQQQASAPSVKGNMISGQGSHGPQLNVDVLSDIRPLLNLFKSDPARAAGQVAAPFLAGGANAARQPIVSGAREAMPGVFEPLDFLKDMFKGAASDDPAVVAARSKFLPKVVKDRLQLPIEAAKYAEQQAAARKLGVDIRPNYGPQVPEAGVPPAPVLGPHELEPGAAGPEYQPLQTTPYPPGKGTAVKYGGPKVPDYGPARPNGVSDSWEPPTGPLTPEGQALAEPEPQAPTPFKPNPNIRRLIKSGGRVNKDVGPNNRTGTLVNPNSAYRQRVLENLGLSGDADAMPAGKAEGTSQPVAAPDDLITQQFETKRDIHRANTINKDAVTEVYAAKKQGMTKTQLDAITNNDSSFKAWVKQLNAHNGTDYRATPEFKVRLQQLLRPKLKD